MSESKSSLITRKQKRFFLLVFMKCILLIPLLFITTPVYESQAHSEIAVPIEIFSLWNNTGPTIDGSIEFSLTNMSTEWSSSAIYTMYDRFQNPTSKFFLQNNDSHLFIAMDMVDYGTEPTNNRWGCEVYFDLDHNGKLSSVDRSIRFLDNTSLIGSTGQYVSYLDYSTSIDNWKIIEEATIGTELSTSEILLDYSLSDSYFNSTNHIQYELRIPLTTLGLSTGEMTGFAIEAFNNYESAISTITWPYISNTPNEIYTSAEKWSDLFLAEETSYVDYLIEENFNIDSGAIGDNNYTVMTSGDVDGDGDLELVVGSNRNITTEEPLLAIYDYSGDTLNQLWTIKGTTHEATMLIPQDLACEDFDEDGQDEIYIVGYENRVIRLYNWTGTDFETSEDCISYSVRNLGGHIEIGDVNHDDVSDIVVNTELNTAADGGLLVYEYVNGTDSFGPNTFQNITAADIDGSTPYRILGFEIADMDNDNANEIIFASQLDSNNTLSKTRIQIVEYVGFPSFSFIGNTGDDLPDGSSEITEDRFIHTIISDDIDNDAANEIVIIGRDYLRIFGKNTFSNPEAPLEFLINDSSTPIIGGGAIIGDIDSDSSNELVFGSNNGTLYFMNITDAGSDVLSYNLEWKLDNIGHAPGYKESMILLDLDNDSENEVFLGDNYGQIMSIGNSDEPDITSITPTTGTIRTSEEILIEWITVDDYQMHHFDISKDGAFYARVSGSQEGFNILLSEGICTILVNGFDITGKNDSISTTFTIKLDAPEVIIDSPSTGFITNNPSVLLELSFFDKNGTDNLDYYHVIIDDINDTNIPIAASTDTTTISLSGTGNHNVTVIIYDDQGNFGKDTIFIFLDTINPTVDITKPTDLERYVNTANVQIEWTASDTHTDIDYFEIYINSQYFNTTTSYSEVVLLGYDYDYTVLVRAFDIAGNFAEDFIILTKDSIDPSINITTPSTDFIVTDQILLDIEWSNEDNFGGTGIENTVISVNGVDVYDDTGTSTQINLQNDGYKSIIVSTYDKAGNVAQDYLTVIVDSTNPEIMIVDPVDNFNTSLSSVILNWYSSDTSSGIQEYQIYRNGSLLTTITDPTITWYEADLFPANSTAEFTITAIDVFGNQHTDTIYINRYAVYPEITITSPIQNPYYTNITEISLTWDVNSLLSYDGFVIYVNETETYTLNNLTFSKNFDFWNGSINQYPVFNVTVQVYSSLGNYSDTIWIKLDQIIPTLTIDSPANQTIFYNNNIILIEWTGSDAGSGIYKYIIKNNGQIINTIYTSQQSDFIIFNELANGFQLISVEAYDYAQNKRTATVNVTLDLLLPEVSIDLPVPFYTNNGSVNFNLTVTNVQSGVKNIFVYVDETSTTNNRDLTFDYSSDISTVPFTEYISIQSIHYNSLIDQHTLVISIIDSYDREFDISRTFYTDINNPPVLRYIRINERALLDSSSTTDIELNKNATSFYIEVDVIDNLGVKSVQARFIGSSIDRTFDLSPTNASGIYTITISLETIAEGDYQIQIIATDFANNNITETYSISIFLEQSTPWFLEPRNIAYISIAAAALFILIIVISVIVRKRVINLGWKNEIVTAAYILNGLPCVYMMNKPEKIKGDLLFGGAMTGIRGVLEEITGEKSKLKIQSVDIGQKKVLICPGNYGDSVLMLNEIKPIHKEKLIEFTKAFEKDYEHLLKRDDLMITPETFPGANILVQVHFGMADQMELVDECDYEDVDMSIEDLEAYKPVEQQQQQYPDLEEQPAILPQQVIEKAEKKVPAKIIDKPIEQIIAELPFKIQKIFIDLIETTQKAIDAIFERDFETTRAYNATLLEILESLLTNENIPWQAQYIIQSVFTISQELVTAIDSGSRGEEEMFKRAVENASQIWIEEISEKW